LQPGVSRQRAQAELDGVLRGLAARFPKDDKGLGARLRPLPEALVGDYRGRLFLLLGAVAFVLLIACGNVANLPLARVAARGKELAIRAGRNRIVRQLLTESAVLALLAGAVGVGLAGFGVRALVGSAPGNIPRLAETRVDGSVLAFALATALAASLLAGLLPLSGGTEGARRSSGSTGLRAGRNGRGPAPGGDARTGGPTRPRSGGRRPGRCCPPLSRKDSSSEQVAPLLVCVIDPDPPTRPSARRSRRSAGRRAPK
jgi:putative ABC transport system permease protein